MTNPYRLDRTFEPIVYDIEIEPDLSQFTFTGRERITLNAKTAFSSVVLHALELTITGARLYRGLLDSHPVESVGIRYDATFETASLDFGATLAAGDNLVLELVFSGSINDKMHGLYRTSYEIGNEKHWGAATQFEATDARRLFPCWDEPDHKASFALTVRVPKHLTALSNMPVAAERSIPGTDLKSIAYEPTPRMSTYLLAFVVAELECVQAKDRRGIPVRIWTTPGKKEQGRFALKVGRHALDYFGRWFGIPYALPKLDMVALPDFASGAMENWGLVTYRETALLVDPKNSSVHARQRVADVIAHELAHQWFGNLVTMEWWTDLWLNEGFASYMGPKEVQDQFPEWQVWSQFVATEYLAALRDDSLKNSHPIEIPVQNPHEIREIFDHITYSKGSSVNRMLEHYLSEPVFRKGLGVYLNRYAWKNARTEDLWQVLEEISGKPVKAIMASFTKQEGYPVLIAKESRDGRKIALTQQRFYFDGRKDRTRRRWSVPIIAIAKGSKKPVYATLVNQRATLAISSRNGWIKLNAGQSGFYRTAYSSALLAKLSSAVAAKELSAIDCLGLLDDTFALARAGFLRTSAALDLVAACGGYTDYNVWLTAAGILQSVEHALDDAASRKGFEDFARGLFKPLAERAGWEPKRSDGHLDAMLRSLLFSRLGQYSDPDVVSQAQERFQRFIRKGELAPDLRGAIFAIVARHGDKKESDQLLKVYRAAGLQEERVRVLRALTFFRSKKLVEEVLAFALSDKVRRQDAFMVLAGFGHNPVGRAVAWHTVKKHWDELQERYASGGLGLMARIIEGATSGFTTQAELKDAESFFAAHPVPGTERAMRQALEALKATIGWAKRDRADIKRWIISKTR